MILRDTPLIDSGTSGITKAVIEIRGTGKGLAHAGVSWRGPGQYVLTFRLQCRWSGEFMAIKSPCATERVSR